MSRVGRRGSPRRRLIAGLAFLLPSFLGFAAFTLIPLVASFGIAFTDWDALRHNIFRHESLRFVGFENFSWLFHHPDFLQYLGNTFFMMLGLPFSIAGSLGAALLLTRVSDRPVARRGAFILATLVLTGSGLLLRFGGVSQGGVWCVFGVLAAASLVGGVLTGGSVYRTLFYLPNFTAGVATFVLWKKLYNPQTGPINIGLAPALDQFAAVVRAAPVFFSWGVPLTCALLALALMAWQVRRLVQHWDDATAGWVSVLTGLLMLALPVMFQLRWLDLSAGAALGVAAAAMAVAALFILRRPPSLRTALRAGRGFSAEIALALGSVPLLALLAIGVAFGSRLPVAAQTGLTPPNWLGDYDWAKPAIMIMGLWAAIGSNNMIMYLAGLTTIPPELYEAADIDGASPVQRFWHITWPQLAPVTFFVGVTGIIFGLQGGFEMARVMTMGGPAGSTTTLSYFIYIEGFETGRLGYASAAAWVLFALVFALSMLNFRFGNRSAND